MIWIKLCHLSSEVGTFSPTKCLIIFFGLCFAGKKGFEGIEGSGENSGHIPGAASEEASRRDAEVYAGAAPCSSQSKSKIRYCRCCSRRSWSNQAGRGNFLKPNDSVSDMNFKDLKHYNVFVLQKGWCGSRGTVEEVKNKHQMRREGAAKRERALAYSILQQVTRVSSIFLLSHYCLTSFNLVLYMSKC